MAREGREAAENWKTIPYDGVRLRKALKMLVKSGEELRVCYEAGPTGFGLVPASAGGGDRLHRGGAFVGAGQAGRPREDRPPRRPETGALPAFRRSDGGLRAGRGRGGDPRPGACPGRRQVRRARGAAPVEQVSAASRPALGRNHLDAEASRLDPHAEVRVSGAAAGAGGLPEDRGGPGGARGASDRAMEELVEETVLAPLVKALQAFRGISVVSAVTIAAEVGDLRRFATASQFMSYVGLVPSEDSTGKRRRQGPITRCGNAPPAQDPGGGGLALPARARDEQGTAASQPRRRRGGATDRLGGAEAIEQAAVPPDPRGQERAESGHRRGPRVGGLCLGGGPRRDVVGGRMRRRSGEHPCRSFARIVRATRGTRPLPLDPLPSSLCSVFRGSACLSLTSTLSPLRTWRRGRVLGGKRFGESLSHP